MHKKLMGLLLVGTLLATTGCKNIFRSYRIDIVQGQVVTQEQADQIKPGMTPAQVRYVLGTPLITDTLNPQRWDYEYRFLPGTYSRDAGLVKVPHRRFSVFFADGVVTKTEADGALPSKTTSLPGSKDSAVRATDTTRKEDAQRP